MATKIILFTDRLLLLLLLLLLYDRGQELITREDTQRVPSLSCVVVQQPHPVTHNALQDDHDSEQQVNE